MHDKQKRTDELKKNETLKSKQDMKILRYRFKNKLIKYLPCLKVSLLAPAIGLSYIHTSTRLYVNFFSFAC